MKKSVFRGFFSVVFLLCVFPFCIDPVFGQVSNSENPFGSISASVASEGFLIGSPIQLGSLTIALVSSRDVASFSIGEGSASARLFWGWVTPKRLLIYDGKTCRIEDLSSEDPFLTDFILSRGKALLPKLTDPGKLEEYWKAIDLFLEKNSLGFRLNDLFLWFFAGIWLSSVFFGFLAWQYIWLAGSSFRKNPIKSFFLGMILSICGLSAVFALGKSLVGIPLLICGGVLLPFLLIFASNSLAAGITGLWMKPSTVFHRSLFLVLAPAVLLLPTAIPHLGIVWIGAVFALGLGSMILSGFSEKDSSIKP